MRVARPLRTFLTALAVTAAALPAVAPVAGATDLCVEAGDVLVGTGPHAFRTTIVDCSSGGTVDQVAQVLGESDAFRLGLLAGKDRFLANDEWVAWIDTHAAPGILRGLWEVDGDARFVGGTRPGGTGGHQSLLAIGDQYVTQAADTMGYMGLHVEIWQAPESAGGDYFTYRHGGTNQATYTTSGGQTSASYGMQLFSRRTGGATFTGSAGGSTNRVTYDVIYTMTPTRFHIEARLNAEAPVATVGDLGGLLLLTTQACDPSTASCPSSIPGHSLHVLDGTTTGAAPTGCTPSDGQVTVLADSGTSAAWDLYGQPYTAATLATDRYCAQQQQMAPHTDAPLGGFTLRTDPGSSIGLSATPGFWFNDPYEAPQGHRQLFAYHVSPPAAVGAVHGDGVVGGGSLDVVYQASPGGSLAFGGNRGYKTFTIDLDH